MVEEGEDDAGVPVAGSALLFDPSGFELGSAPI